MWPVHALGRLRDSPGTGGMGTGHAEDTGDPYNAAMTYVDAALLAQETGDSWATMDLAYLARALVSSPDLDIDQRALILDRVEPGWRR